MGKTFNHLTWQDRLTIERMLNQKYSPRIIADAVGCSVRTIYYEIKRARYGHLNSDLTMEERYNPDAAQKRYEEHLQEKSTQPKILKAPLFREEIRRLIVEEKYSPEAALLAIKRSGIDYGTTISSPATIYRAIRRGYIEGVTMRDCPLRGKKKQKRQQVQRQARATAGTSIEKRPESVLTREQFGHWEMDSIVGPPGSKPAALVFTERKTRMEIIEPLRDHTTREVTKALNRVERRYGSAFYRVFLSITVDNGSEFSDTDGIEKALNRVGKRTDLYYCHPRSPQERGSNEVNNKLIRRHIPKGKSLKGYTSKDLKDIEAWMNDYPRRQFKGASARELYEVELQALGFT